MNDWSNKPKGNAKIYTHPNVDRAIIENFKGVFFDGKKYASVQEAKNAAMNAAMKSGDK